MPATPDTIAAGTREVQIETWADGAIKARYVRARDGSEAPAEGFFDLASDAAAVLIQRAALLGTERRRFKVVVDELIWPDPGAGIPTVQLVDSEHSVSAPAIVCRVELNLETEQTLYEVLT